MTDFKIGDRVRILSTIELLGVKKDDLATVVHLDYSEKDLHFVNTDKLNWYNHSEYNGNGLLLGQDYLELVSRNPIKPKRPRWDNDSTEYLHSYYHRKKVKELSLILNRPTTTISSKASYEGLSKHNRREFNNIDNRHIIHGLIDGATPEQLALDLHRSKSSVVGRINLMTKRGLIPQFNKEVLCK